MTKLNKFLSVVLCLAMLCSVFAVTGTAMAVQTDETSVSASTEAVASSANASGFSWDNASVYFLLTDRFQNGNTSNDHSYGRSLNQSGQVVKGNSDAGAFHGGDFAGITQKIKDGYFDDLGVNALWISAPYEQMHGYCNAGSGKTGSFPHYSYHGYYALDFSEFDNNFGTPQEFQTMVDTAHEHGIRIVLDIVMNHVGYNNFKDMSEYGYGTLKSGWETGYYNATLNDITYHNYIDYNNNASDWAKWFGSDWLRAGLAGYKQGSGELEGCQSYLPDLKENVTSAVDIPYIYKTKWGKEGTLSQKQSELNSYFSSTGKQKNVRGYLVYWLSRFVENYGVDGFRCDTAKHVSMDSWKALKDQCKQSLKTWRQKNPGKVGADWTDDFWMTGECFPHYVNKDNYYTSGAFDSMLNFSFNASQAFDASGSGVPGVGSIDSTYSDYANKINNDDSFNVLSYLSSHDTSLCRNNSIYQGSAFQLLPGGIQIYYGDESNRPVYGGLAAGKDHNTRSDMNWNSLDQNVLKHWQKVGQFRNNHIAVGAGSHKKITASSGYAFQRVYNKNGKNDKVMAVISASNNTNVTVTVDSTVFPDGTQIKNAYDGTTATVSGGKVSFNSGANGTILMETGAEAKTFSVTNTLSNVTSDNSAATAKQGTSYSANLTAKTGYTLGTVKVTMNGSDVTSSAYSNGRVSISNVTGDIVIVASATAQTFTIQKSLVRATLSNSASTVTYGSSYQTDVVPNDGCSISTVIVLMGTNTITNSVYSNGKISIPSVTDNITVSVIAKANPTTTSTTKPTTTSTTKPTTTSTTKPTTTSTTKPTTTTSTTTSTTKPTTTSTTKPTSVTGSSSSESTPIVTTPSVTVPAGQAYMYGDVNLDGKITIKDAVLIQKYLVESAIFSSQQSTVADVNKDGKITIRDAVEIQKYLVNDETSTYPIGKVVEESTSTTKGTTTSSTKATTTSTTKPTTSSTTKPEGQTFDVINSLTFVTNSNSAETVKEGSTYSATLTPNAGYAISTVMVMNGDDMEEAVANANGTYSTSFVVKGDVMIVAIAVESATTITTSTTTATTSTTTSTTSTTSTTTQPITDGKTITLVDGTPEGWLANGSAVFVVTDNSTGTAYEMQGGAGTWTVTVPNSVTNITINRNSPEGETWNSWTTSVSGDTYTATGSGTGSWGGDPGPGPGPGPSGQTIKFTNNAGWSSANAYFFDSNGDVGPAWPGSPMTSIGMNDFGEEVFEIEVPSGAVSVVFNGDGDQTEDVTIGSNEGFYTTGARDGSGNLICKSWSDTSGGGDIGGGGSGGNTSGTVQFTDNAGWGTVYAYFFDSNGDVGPAWPGTQMQNIGDNGFGQQQYSVAIPEGAEFVIFNNGNGTQTANTKLGHTGYYTDGTQGEGGLLAIGWD